MRVTDILRALSGATRTQTAQQAVREVAHFFNPTTFEGAHRLAGLGVAGLSVYSVVGTSSCQKNQESPSQAPATPK